MHCLIFKKSIQCFIVSSLLFTAIVPSMYSYESYSPERPMRILFVVGYFPVLPETFIINQITKLIDEGHEVFIYSFRKGNFKKVHSDVHKYHLLKRTSYGRFPAKAPQFDIVYCQFGIQGAKLLKIKRRYKFKSKIVTCFRGSDISCYLRRRPRAYRELFKSGDLFLPVCKFFRQRLIKRKCDPKKIIVHHSAVDCEKFSYKKGTLRPGKKIRIVTVGRLVEKKGIKYSIRAIAKLIQKYPYIEYTIIGDGPLREELALLIKTLKLEDHVVLHGAATHNKVVDTLAKAHIFVLASVEGSDGNQEGIPNVLKEAMACGIPVVSTFHAGIPELVEDGISGLLTLQRNTGDLAKKIQYLIMHPEVWESMGQAGRKKVEQEFEIEKTVNKLERLFRGLLKKG